MLIDKICDEIDILEKDYFSCSYKDSQDVQVCRGYGGRGRETGMVMGERDGRGRWAMWREREGDGREVREGQHLNDWIILDRRISVEETALRGSVDRRVGGGGGGGDVRI